MQRRVSSSISFVLGFLACSLVAVTLAVTAFRFESGYSAVALPFTIGIASSILASLVTAAVSLRYPQGYKILASEDDIYAEAEEMVRQLAESPAARLRNVSVTALVRKETENINPGVNGYLRALNELLESATSEDDVVYKVLGSFGKRELVNGFPALVGYQAALDERLALFKSDKARRRIDIKSFNEVWPVDVLVVRDEVIVAFRDHDRGGLSWGLRIKNAKVSSKVLHWLEDLWGDDKKSILLVKKGAIVYQAPSPVVPQPREVRAS